MNKGFEVIEAHWLFGVNYSNIKVVIHPQSIVHSFVEFKDNTLKAQMGFPDMRTCAQFAFSFPERLANAGFSELNLKQLNSLSFEEPDTKKFPCLKYVYEAGKIGGTMPAALNAANEKAVEYFLKGKISYGGISRTARWAMDRHKTIKRPSLDDILETDKEVKIKIAEFLDTQK